MATLLHNALEYFSTINPLARKILQEQDAIQKAHGDNWTKLTREEQDSVLDGHFIGNDIRDNYPDFNHEEYPTSFPKLLVNCGEKIVVDFDKECWTWRDEHSSPFSWETRSQQDLNIWEDDDEGLGGEPLDDTEETKKPKKKSRSRSPERDVPLAFKPERSIWESPFLAADRGLDAGYHSSQASDQSTKSSCDAEDTDSVLKNFSLAMSLSGSHTGLDDTKLLDSSFEVEEMRTGVPASANYSQRSWDSADGSLQDSPKQPRNQPQSANHVEGHAPLYLEDPGESSTDVTTEVVFSQFNFAPEEGTSEPVESLLSLDTRSDDVRASASLLAEDCNSSLFTEELDTSTSCIAKSGFDFLDNW